jgi:hypothetical protein
VSARIAAEGAPVEAGVKAIREALGAAPNAAITAWVRLAEALIHFYSHPGRQATECPK